MRSVYLTPEAETDLAKIFDFTVDRWNVEQAIYYVNELRSTCRSLKNTPSIGRDRKMIRGGLRSLHHASQIIYYFIEPQRILIIRILHQRMKPTRKRFTDLR